jgi:transcription antitermination factor NusG
MRLRNLYELAVAPGERKGFSLRLKKLEDLQMKIAEMQNTITNLKGTDVPDVLKKQMNDLIDSASMEKEKLYSEIESAEGRNKTANGIPGNVLKLLKGIEKNSTTIMNAYRNTGKFLYRGIKSDDDALYGKPFDSRRPKDSNAGLNAILNKALGAAGFAARRDNTSFTSGTYNQASNYGTVYIFFPRDGFQFHYSKSIRDLVLDTGKLNLLLDDELVKKIRKLLEDNWQELEYYFSNSPYDFLSGYSYESDIRGLQKAVADGKLPAELGKFQTLDDFVDPAKVISQMEYNQSDLDGAITSGHEVMVTGPYYALRDDKFKDYVKKYLEMTKLGSVDITPDTPTEAGDLDAKINAMLGQKPDGFLIGDWVQHKYEESLKGEVVNNFYTNDFLMIKTYEGKLELVKNSNAKKMATPTIPKYEVGDKLYIRSKGTKYTKFNNQYGKVVSVDGSMVTVAHGGYSNAVVPIMLTEPAPKYDTENPSVGDTVHITDGALKGSYGVITYVSSYGDIDVEIDGDAESISKGTFTVIDPATKPVDDTPLKFTVGDFVEITGNDNSNWNGYVGTIVTPGKNTSKVQIMNGDDGNGAPKSVKIPNNNINIITKEEHDSRSFKYGDLVTVTGGKYAGKTGKVSYFYSTGTIELILTGGDGYADVKLGDLNLSSALAATTPKNEEISTGDKVTITAGLYKGLTGTVKGIGYSFFVELGNQTVSVVKTNLKKENNDAVVSTNTISIGDRVKIIGGEDVGKTGTIYKLGKAGTYIKLDDGTDENMYVFNSSIEKIDGSDDDLIDLDDIDFETFDEPKKTTTPTKAAASFKMGDKVKIKSGDNAGKIGKVNYTWSTIPAVDVIFDDGGSQWEVPYADLEIVDPASEEPATANKFKIGDAVMITSGNFKDFDGTITSDINSSNEYMVKVIMFGKAVEVPISDFSLSLVKKEPTDNTKQAVKDLIAKGKADGKVTYADLNTAFPAGEVDSEQVEDIMNKLGELGIDVVDDSGLFEPSGNTPDQLLAAVARPQRKQGLLDVFKDSTAKLYIKNAVDGKYMSNEILIELVGLIGYDKYTDFVKPYLELKGVTFGSY